MKVSFVIVTSSTVNFVKHDPKSWPERDNELDQAINTHTNKLLRQILKIPIEKEIILVDDSNDFILDQEDDRLKVVPGYGYLLETGQFNPEEYSFVKDIDSKIPPRFTHTTSNAISLNIGLTHVTGDYIILQHNDTYYLPDLYGSWSFITDAIELLEEKNYEFITVDKKPHKSNSVKYIQFFNDAYWFLCKSDFYKKHEIWVDWSRGDCNHLATMTCYDKKLPYLNLPGYYENDPIEAKAWFEYFRMTYNRKTSTNIHYLNGKAFFEHHKGGTGLRRTLTEKANDETNHI